MLPTPSTLRRSRPLRLTATAALGVAALALSAGAPTAGAAIVEGESIEAFLGSDMVGTVGYGPEADVELVRNGNVIATATNVGSTVLNHDDCWDGTTAHDVLPGDVIRAGTNPAAMDSMTVQNISLNHAALVTKPLTNDVTIVGDAGPAGAVLGFRFSGLVDPDDRHELDLPPGPFNRTTTINDDQFDAWPPATSLESLVNGNELTISDPVAGGTCGPLLTTAIGSVTPSSLNASPANVTISGVAVNTISGVQIRLNGVAHGAPVVPSGGSWSKTIPYADFAEGDNQIVSQFAGTGAPADQTRTVTKDTAAPAAPSVAPGGGSYTEAQSVTVNGVEGGGSAYYTTDGSEPTEGSTRYTGPISITSSQTLKVAQYDAAGNRSATATHAYVISSPPAAQQPQRQTPAPIVIFAPPRIDAPSANLISASGLRLRGSRSLRTLRRTGLKYSVRPSGQTRYLLVRLVRVTRSGRRTKRALVQERVITVRGGRTYSGTLRLGRRTKTGRYELSVTPAGTDEEYATAVRAAFTVTR